MKKLFGIFIVCLVYANCAHAYITSNVSQGCRPSTRLEAVFEPATYNCSAGYYLPANSETCAACLSGYTCPGGTFPFNATSAQGMAYDDLISSNVSGGCNSSSLSASGGHARLNARFEPNRIFINFYDNGTQVTGGNVATSCDYGDVFDVPSSSSVQQRTGYVFKGWKVRQAQ